MVAWYGDVVYGFPGNDGLVVLVSDLGRLVSIIRIHAGRPVKHSRRAPSPPLPYPTFTQRVVNASISSSIVFGPDTSIRTRPQNQLAGGLAWLTDAYDSHIRSDHQSLAKRKKTSSSSQGILKAL